MFLHTKNKKQSVAMSINDFVEITIFLCLIYFSSYDKMQGFIDECVCFFIISLSLFIYSFFFFLHFTQKFKMAEIDLSSTVSTIEVFLCFMQKFKMAAKNGGKAILRKSGQ